MSWQAVEWALERAPMLTTGAGKKDTTARFVLVALAEHADKTAPRPRAHPSLALLRFETGFDMKTVQRALGRLADADLIEAVGVRGDGVTEWELRTESVRPDSDRDEIDAEVQAHRERDRRRKQNTRLSGRNAPDATTVSGAQSPEVRTQNPGQRSVSGALNPDSGALRPDVRDAEPARTGHGTGQEPVNARERARGADDDSLPGLLLALPVGERAKPGKDPAPDHEAEFDAWYAAYPRAAAPQAAYRAYVKARLGQKVHKGDRTRTPATAEQLLDAATRFAAQMRREHRPKDKIPYPATWLNSDDWQVREQPAPRRVVNGPSFDGW